jgi:hypothetical protein
MPLQGVKESVNTRIFGCPGFSGLPAFRLSRLPAFRLSRLPVFRLSRFPAFLPFDFPAFLSSSFPDIRLMLGSAS